MKKIIAFAAFLAFTLTASAQARLGLKGGLNISKMSLNSEVFEAKNRVGFFIGPTIKGNLKAFNMVNLGFDAAALYEQRNAKLEVVTNHVSSSAVSSDVKRSAISVPVNVRLGVGYGDSFEAFVKAGPQVSFNLGSDKIELETFDQTISAAVKDTEYSVNIGAGVMVMSKLEVSANYNIVMGNSVKDLNMDNYDSKVKYSWKDLKNNAWQVSATWYF